MRNICYEENYITVSRLHNQFVLWQRNTSIFHSVTSVCLQNSLHHSNIDDRQQQEQECMFNIFPLVFMQLFRHTAAAKV